LEIASEPSAFLDLGCSWVDVRRFSLPLRTDEVELARRGRELQALGHTIKLIPPSYVKAYLKRSKNDANDAAAICEAVTRPSMRFVPVKTREQQSALMLHRTRQLLVRC
jgi:transposase